MTDTKPSVLLVGEIFVDVTVTPRSRETKLRLGGITHAARGLWATRVPFKAAAVLPRYLERAAEEYFRSLGCDEFIIAGNISGAPNVILIFDPEEVDEQGYEALLRDDKVVSGRNVNPQRLAKVTDAIVFPGKYDLKAICECLPPTVKLHIDIGYDIQSVDELRGISRGIATLFMSTSSQLFRDTGGGGMDDLAASFAVLRSDTMVLKENRGGSRL